MRMQEIGQGVDNIIQHLFKYGGRRGGYGFRSSLNFSSNLDGFLHDLIQPEMKTSNISTCFLCDILDTIDFEMGLQQEILQKVYLLAHSRKFGHEIINLSNSDGHSIQLDVHLRKDFQGGIEFSSRHKCGGRGFKFHRVAASHPNQY
ncbi:hypothetical protein H5410_050999 [Solanum commersonii]|uniref:Uncharacterized protein n=1 Tax=Solanum commersonii TaxID=4109 RepID=A0A9J5WZ86_SOLCO|nr:hypothetical protein H5410_050999 [Solanum commersonii]